MRLQAVISGKEGVSQYSLSWVYQHICTHCNYYVLFILTRGPFWYVFPVKVVFYSFSLQFKKNMYSAGVAQTVVDNCVLCEYVPPSSLWIFYNVFLCIGYSFIH